MPSLNRLSWNAVYTAASQRLVELAAAVRRAEQALDDRTAERHEQSFLALANGLDAAALSRDLLQRERIISELVETYGLLAVATDPLLQPSVPLLPPVGGVLRFRVRAYNGKYALFNGKHLLTVGATILPA